MLGCWIVCVNRLEVYSRAPQCRESHAKLMPAVGQSPTPPPSPPFCSDCGTKTQPAGGGAATQSASRMWRSSDGKFRLDTPTSSVISDPASQHAILLDHVKKEATIIPTPAAEQGRTPAASSQSSSAAGEAAPVQVQDLGKSTIEGHEVEGKRFTLPPFAPPAMPETPKAKVPGAAASPSGAPKPLAAPGAPAAPQAPKLTPVPSVTEVWT